MDDSEDERIRQLEEQMKQIQKQLKKAKLKKLQSQNHASTSSLSSSVDQDKTIQPNTSQQHRKQSKEDNNAFPPKFCTSAKNKEKKSVTTLKAGDAFHEPSSPQRKVSSGTKSALKPNQFPKRTEAVDHGKKFEELMCGLYALKFSVDDEVENFQMTSNSKECGDFDDIEIKVVFKDGRKRRFMIQLKHKDNASILKRGDFEKEKGPYSLKKYFETISKIEGDDDDVFILYTNNNVNLDADFNFCITTDAGEDTIEIKKCAHFEQLLLNSTNRSVFEFRSQKSNKILYLYAQQDNIGAVEIKLRKILQEYLNCNIYSSLTYYLHKWWSQNYILTKHDFIVKLTELALSPFMQHLSSEKVNDQTKILTQAILGFEMTIVRDDEEIISQIWDTQKLDDSSKEVEKRFTLTESRESDAWRSKLAWFLETAPFVVKVDETNKATISAVLKLLKKSLRNKKILLVGNVSTSDFKNWKIFEKLSDLSGAIHGKIINDYKISLQGRPAIPLHQLTQINECVSEYFGTKELLEMTQNKCCVGTPREKLPELHIPRSVVKIEVQKDEKQEEIIASVVKENDIFNNFKSKLNVFCAPPGMGKSRLLQSLNYNCPPESWATFVNLRDCSSFAKNSKPENIILKFVGLSGENEDLLETKIKKLFFEQKKIEIFLDGLDEVDSKYLDLVLECVRHMNKEGFNVWMSSRDNLRYKVWETLKATPIEILQLNEEEQKHYIHGKLKDKYSLMQINKIIDASFKNVNLINSQKLLGIPLQLHILTEIFLNNDTAYNQLEEENFFVLTQMYKLFFEGKKSHTLQKTNIDQSKEHLIGLNFEQYLEQYEIPALKVCLDFQDYIKLNLNEGKSSEFLKNLEMQGDMYGVLRVFKSYYWFEHQTFAEYFACVWMKKNRDKLVLLKDSLFSARYENLRRIFDIMLSENHPLHLAVIYENVNEVAKHLDKKFNERDNSGRTAFLLAFTYGKSFDSFNFMMFIQCETNAYMQIVDMLVEKCKDIDQSDKILFDLNWFDCSLDMKLFNVYAIEKLIESKHLTFSCVQKIIQQLSGRLNLEDLGFLCARLGYHILLAEILKQEPELINATDGYGNHILHCAIKGIRNDDCTKPRKRNIATVKLLLINSRDVNAIYYNNYLTLLDYACESGYDDMLEVLIESGAKCGDGNTILHRISESQLNQIVLEVVKKFKIDINAKNDKGETALYLAYQSQNFDNAKILVELGCDLNILDEHKNSVLHMAMQGWMDNFALTKLLVSKGVKINAENCWNQTPLHLAVARKFTESAKHLLENGGDIVDNHKNTILHQLMRCNGDNTEMIKFLIEKGVSINAQNDEGVTALHYAIDKGFFKGAKYLVDNNADVNIQTNCKNTCLHLRMISKNDDTELTNCLIKKGINVNAANDWGTTALHTAALNGLTENAKCLVKTNADVNCQDNDKNTCLHCLMKGLNDNSELTEYLIQKDVDVNKKNANGETALHLAINKRFAESCVHLLKNKADVNIATNRKNTTLHILMEGWSKNDWIGMTQCLIKLGVQINAQNAQGKTALHLALLNRFYESAKILLENNANVNIEDDYKNTSLHIYANYSDENDNTEITKRLIKKGVKVNAQNHDGKTALHYAISPNLRETAKLLLKTNVDVNIKDNNKNTCLHILMASGNDDKHNTETARDLVAKEVDVNAQNNRGLTALHYAISKNHVESTKYLLKNHADPNIKDDRGFTSLHHLIDNKKYTENIKIAKYLVESDVNVNAQNLKGETALLLAVKRRFTETVKYLLENDADANIVDNCKNTSLHWCSIRCDNTELAQHLLEKGVDVNAQNDEGETALLLATQRGKIKMICYLLTQNADLNIKDKVHNTILHFALQAYHINFDFIKELLEKGFHPDTPNQQGITPTLFACESGNFENVLVLNKIKANFCHLDNEGNSALHFAARRDNNIQIIDFLLEEGLNIEVVNRNGQTPLHFACELGDSKTIEHLHQKKANFKTLDHDGNTVLHYWFKYDQFSKYDDKKIIDLLLSEGPQKVNVCNKKGQTPLHFACQFSTLGAVECLLQRNADLKAADNDSNTAFHFLAKSHQYEYVVKEITELLLCNGLSINSCNFYGETPLHLACEYGLADTVEALCEKGADATIIDNQGRSVTDHARRNAVQFDYSFQTEQKTILHYFENQGLNISA